MRPTATYGSGQQHQRDQTPASGGSSVRCSAAVQSPVPRPANPQSRHPFPLRACAAEAAGTGLLVFFGIAGVIALFGEGSAAAQLIPAASLRRAIAGALFGSVGAAVALSPLGAISGAHINPAVTFGFWLEGRMRAGDAWAYGAAQLAGAAVGAQALRVFGGAAASVRYGATVPGPGVGPFEAVGAEAAVTFALVVIVLGFAGSDRLRRFTPWTMPPLFAVLVCVEAKLTGTSANPARSFGPALVSGAWGHAWVYLVGPLLGAAVAVWLLKAELWWRHHLPAARLAHFSLSGKLHRRDRTP